MTPFNQRADYQELVGRINRINHAMSLLETRRLELLAKDVKLASSEAEQEAALRFAETGDYKSLEIPPDDVQAELETATAQARVLRESLLAAHREMNELQRRASQEVCEQLRADHVGLARRMLEALTQVDQIHQQETQFLAAITAAGYSPSFPESVFWPTLGYIEDSSGSALYYRVRELSQYVRRFERDPVSAGGARKPAVSQKA